MNECKWVGDGGTTRNCVPSYSPTCKWNPVLAHFQAYWFVNQVGWVNQQVTVSFSILSTEADDVIGRFPGRGQTRGRHVVEAVH